MSTLTDGFLNTPFCDITLNLIPKDNYNLLYIINNVNHLYNIKTNLNENLITTTTNFDLTCLSINVSVIANDLIDNILLITLTI